LWPNPKLKARIGTLSPREPETQGFD